MVKKKKKKKVINYINIYLYIYKKIIKDDIKKIFLLNKSNDYKKKSPFMLLNKLIDNIYHKIF